MDGIHGCCEVGGTGDAGFRQRSSDVSQRLLGLPGDLRGDRHHRLVEAGRPVDEGPATVHDGPELADAGLERGA